VRFDPKILLVLLVIVCAALGYQLGAGLKDVKSRLQTLVSEALVNIGAEKWEIVSEKLDEAMALVESLKDSVAPAKPARPSKGAEGVYVDGIQIEKLSVGDRALFKAVVHNPGRETISVRIIVIFTYANELTAESVKYVRSLGAGKSRPINLLFRDPDAVIDRDIEIVETAE